MVMIFTGFLIYELLTEYFTHKSFNSSRTHWSNNVTLPAITVCSTNPFDYELLSKDLENDPDLLNDFNNIMERIIRVRKDPEDEFSGTDIAAIKRLIVWEKEKGSLVLRFHEYVFKMMVGKLDYLFRGLGFKIRQEEYYTVSQMTELGFCFEVNDKHNLVQTTGGPDGGFTVDIDAQTKDYLGTTSPRGFVIFLRKQNETVMLNQGGIVVSPGTEMFIKMNARHINRLGKPYGTCRNVESKFSKNGVHYETVRECIQRQILDMMINDCECIPWYLAERLQRSFKKPTLLQDFQEKCKKFGDSFPDYLEERSNPHSNRLKRIRRQAGDKRNTEAESDNDVNTSSEGTSDEFPALNNSCICGFIEEKLCRTDIERRFLSEEVKLKACPEPCSYDEFEFIIFGTSFPPSEQYFEKFLKNDLDRQNTTYEYAQLNIARLHIYFSQIKIDEDTQTKANDIQNFIAQLGGTLDLFIGFSFFTLFQLLEIGIDFCITTIGRRHKTKKEF